MPFLRGRCDLSVGKVCVVHISTPSGDPEAGGPGRLPTPFVRGLSPTQGTERPMDPTPRLLAAGDALAARLDAVLDLSSATPARVLARRLQLLREARQEFDRARREYDRVSARQGC